jgi:hypothetical protein
LIGSNYSSVDDRVAAPVRVWNGIFAAGDRRAKRLAEDDVCAQSRRFKLISAIGKPSLGHSAAVSMTCFLAQGRGLANECRRAKLVRSANAHYAGWTEGVLGAVYTDSAYLVFVMAEVGFLISCEAWSRKSRTILAARMQIALMTPIDMPNTRLSSR